MSPTTVEQLEIDPLPRPAGAERLHPLIGAVEENINRSILLLASGKPGSAPDFAKWLDDKGLPGEGDLDDPKQESVMIDKYKGRQEDTRTLRRTLDQQNASINDSQVAAFSTSNDTYQNIMSIVGELRADLADTPAPTKGEDDVYRLPRGEEFALLRSLLSAVDRVHDEVDNAANTIDTHARQIDGSVPTVPAGYRTNVGGVVPVSATGYQPSPGNVSYTITNPNDPAGSTLEVARSQLGLTEGSGNRVNAPYNINDAWCASFTSWVWDQAGYNVDWTNKNYVPAIWNDAVGEGWNRQSINQAQPGDLIVFDWKSDGTPDHIGIVESVSGGVIHTIEGNTGNGSGPDGVLRKERPISAGNIVGIIAPPPTGSPAGSAVRV
ncbi:CHAP domain-containing protein [Nocardia rhamnosiphila]|uniref:C40 family peptidase n=1 Tax=Nocardia rhamnosiphila TaxID=426716 RepID=UPI00068B9BBC|nr:CHAP domain-containing protein [Nocardia rhamnosiphila]